MGGIVGRQRGCGDLAQGFANRSKALEHEMNRLISKISRTTG